MKESVSRLLEAVFVDWIAFSLLDFSAVVYLL